MGKKITIRLSDAEFDLLAAEAAAVGRTPTEQVAATWRQATAAADHAVQLTALEERLSVRIDSVAAKFDGLLSRLRSRSGGSQ